MSAPHESTCAPEPGDAPVGPSWHGRLDARVDLLLEPLRRWRPTVWLFSVASLLGDFGMLWHIIGIGRAIGDSRRWTQAVTLSALMGIESLTVNQGIKPFFQRRRPTERGDSRFRVRKPRTSSFPSGHASSAFFASIVLAGWTTAPATALWFAFATVIATSRVATRIHHFTDVVVGAFVGAVMGGLALAGISLFG